jgi:hypothetical protein
MDVGMEYMSEQLDKAIEQIQQLEQRIETAEQLINRAVDLMTLDQLSQWEGVRAWQELEDNHGK